MELRQAGSVEPLHRRASSDLVCTIIQDFYESLLTSAQVLSPSRSILRSRNYSSFPTSLEDGLPSRRLLRH